MKVKIFIFTLILSLFLVFSTQTDKISVSADYGTLEDVYVTSIATIDNEHMLEFVRSYLNNDSYNFGETASSSFEITLYSRTNQTAQQYLTEDSSDWSGFSKIVLKYNFVTSGDYIIWVDLYTYDSGSYSLDGTVYAWNCTDPDGDNAVWNYYFDWCDFTGCVLFFDDLDSEDYILLDKIFKFIDKDIWNLAYKKGYNVGYSSGDVASSYQSGYAVGFTDGEDNMMARIEANPSAWSFYNQTQYNAYGTSNYTQGYNAGYSKGVEEANDYSFYTLIDSVINAPLTMLIGSDSSTGLLNTTILGVNLSSFFSSIVTLALAIFIIRLVI